MAKKKNKGKKARKVNAERAESAARHTNESTQGTADDGAHADRPAERSGGSAEPAPRAEEPQAQPDRKGPIGNW